MPRISAFYGIVVCMYWSDHPPAHFHALYGGMEAKVDIEDATILRGALTARAYRLVREWTFLHREELMANWNRSQKKQALEPIEPLI